MKITCNSITLGLENSTIFNAKTDVVSKICPNSWISNKELASGFAKLFNYSDGTRVINFHSGFYSLRQCLGESFDWAFGMVTSDDFKLRIGRIVSDKIKSFLGCESGTGVHVMAQACSYGQCGLEAVKINRYKPNNCYGHSIIVPTGEFSRRFADIPICVRLDVEEPKDGRSIFSLRRVLLSTMDGGSLCGLAAVDDYVVDLREVHSVLTNAVGVGYDVLGVNAILFETWAWHNDHAKDDRYCTDLRVCDANGCPVVVWFEYHNAWRLSLQVDGCRIPFGQLTTRRDYKVDVLAAITQARLVRNLLTQMSPEKIKAAIEYEHCLLDHLDRFGEVFVSMFLDDTYAAVKKFEREVIAAVSRLKSDSEAWPIALFHGGRERTLEYAGEKAATQIQLLAPLYLTDVDKMSHTPTVYLCTGIDLSSGKPASVFFPSVLEVSAAEADHRFFRRMVRQAIRSGEHYAKAV